MSTLTYITGDVFAAPPKTILVHACNTEGSWGAGIALTFKEKYPAQFELYEAHCHDKHEREAEGRSSLVGTCFLIPGEVHDIACLFTSKGYGRRKDKPAAILGATRSAVEDLKRQNVQGKELHACRFNSGKFAVPWSSTEAILEELGVAMTIYTPFSPE